MARLIIIVSLSLGLFFLAHDKASAQGAATGLVAVNYALYSEKTELFEEYTPLIVGQTVRSTAHLTKLGDTFIAYTDATVDVTLTIEGVAIKGHAEDRSGPAVFRVFLTPTRAGTGRMEGERRDKGLHGPLRDRWRAGSSRHGHRSCSTDKARLEWHRFVAARKNPGTPEDLATAPVRKERGIIVVPGKLFSWQIPFPTHTSNELPKGSRSAG